nr:transposase [Streptomyces sp. NBC_00899]
MAKHLDEQVAALRNRPQGASPYAFVRADAGWPAFLRSLRRALALRKEDRPPQRRIAVTVRDVNRRTRSQENLNSQWSLGLSREMQPASSPHRRLPPRRRLRPRAPAGHHVPISSRIVHRRPPQPIPTRHADHPQPA